MAGVEDLIDQYRGWRGEGTGVGGGGGSTKKEVIENGREEARNSNHFTIEQFPKRVVKNFQYENHKGNRRLKRGRK